MTRGSFGRARAHAYTTEPFFLSAFMLTALVACGSSPQPDAASGDAVSDAGAAAIARSADASPGDATAGPGGDAGTTGSGSTSGSSSGTSGGSGGGSSQAPHALGVIALGETHVSGASTSTPSVSATFVADSAVVSACTTPLAGCFVPAVPTCDGTSGPICSAGQTCALDSSCNATCLTPCSAQCPAGQECYFETASLQACRSAADSFNAGALAFSGTTAPLTLYPPYAFTSTTSGSLFLAGASLEVQAAGATSVGFAPFTESFSATTFLQTSPSLATIPPSALWGTGSIAIGWVPGSDTVVVGVAGPLGTAQCPASDAAGQLEIPHAVVAAVAGGGTPPITFSVTRRRTATSASLPTVGMGAGATTQPIGTLDVETSSTESFSVASCPAGQTLCEDGCQDLLTSVSDCGSCQRACVTVNAECSAGAQVCLSGTCACNE